MKFPVLLLSLLLLAAPAGAAEENWSGEQATQVMRATLTARDQQAWKELWQRAGQAAPYALPEGQMAVAIFLGRRSSGGYGVEIVNVVEQDGYLNVSFRETEASALPPGKTAPYTIRLVPHTNMPVAFERLY